MEVQHLAKMKAPPPTGAFINPGPSIENSKELVQHAEEMGYDSVWLTQISGRDTPLVASEYARATTRIRIGTGVLPIYARTPANMAQVAATLGEISGGRFILGVGTSHKPAVEKRYGQRYEKPLADMREYLGIVRAILADGRVDFRGQRFRTTWTWGDYQPKIRVPLYMSALSEKMLRLAGEVADGVVLWCCTPAYVRDYVIPNLRAGAKSAGRDLAAIEVVAAVPASATTDAAAAKAAFRSDLVHYWSLANYRRVIRRSGFAEWIDDFDQAMTVGGPAAAGAAIPDAYLDSLAGIGDETSIRSKIDEYRASGVTVPAVGPISIPDAPDGTAATLEAAAPTLRPTSPSDAGVAAGRTQQ